MKSFFKIFFACLFAFGVAFFIFFVFIIGGIINSGSEEKEVTKIEPNSILNLTLKGEITDRPYNNPFRNLNAMSAFSGSISDEPTIGLMELKQALKYAKTDDHIKGVYLNFDKVELKPATLFDLAETLEDFKKSGKLLYAYSNSISEKNMLLHTTANKFYINPLGECEFDGVALQREYMKGLFDKLGIEFKVFYVGEYKSATEGMRRTDMSPEDRYQSTEILNDISDSYLTLLSKNRKIPVNTLKSLQDNLSVIASDEAVNYGLADATKYEDEVMDEIKSKLGYKKTDAIKMVSYHQYNDFVKTKIKNNGANKIAIVYAEGEINDSKEDEGTVGGEAYVKIIRDLQKDDKIKGVVLRINSPGGSAFASEQIYHELKKLKTTKPIVVSMGDYAASGGYYIAAISDKIIAQPNTLTGSIGIFGMVPNVRKALNDKLGITFDEVVTAKHANFFNLTNDWDEVESTKIQNMLEKGYAIFLDRVANGRKTDTSSINKIARGRVWTGQDAKQIGLVDELGGIDLAIQRVKELAKIKDASIENFPKEKTMIESIMKTISGKEDDETVMMKNISPEQLFLLQLNRIKSLGTLQYKMAYDISIQ